MYEKTRRETRRDERREEKSEREREAAIDGYEKRKREEKSNRSPGAEERENEHIICKIERFLPQFEWKLPWFLLWGIRSERKRK